MKIHQPARLLHEINGRYYRHALLETVLQTESKTVLEIGTNHGVTTRLLAEICDHVVTADIKKYVDVELNNVTQVTVYPHTWDVLTKHYVTKEEIFDLSTVPDTIDENFYMLNFMKYDLIFLDGDHTETSFLKDFEICHRLNTKYIVIDDYKNTDHEVYSGWQKIKHLYEDKYEVYDYADWNVWVDMLLLKRI